MEAAYRPIGKRIGRLLGKINLINLGEGNGRGTEINLGEGTEINLGGERKNQPNQPGRGERKSTWERERKSGHFYLALTPEMRCGDAKRALEVPTRSITSRSRH